MTSEEKALLEGLDERSDIFHKALMRAVQLIAEQAAKIKVLEEKVSVLIVVSNQQSLALEDVLQYLGDDDILEEEGTDYVH